MNIQPHTRFRELVGGIWVILSAVLGYIWMHVFFFGIPKFSTATAMGKSEIGYALGTLMLVFIGAYAVYRGMRRRPYA